VEESGIGTNTPVNASLKGISLRSALNLILSELELTFIVEYEVLRITTEAQVDYMPITRAYDVSSLLNEDKDARAIVKMMQATRIQRRQSREQLNNFPIFAYKQLIVARTTHRGHRHLAELLRTLDAGLGGNSDARQELEIGHRHPGRGKRQRAVGESKDQAGLTRDKKGDDDPFGDVDATEDSPFGEEDYIPLNDEDDTFEDAEDDPFSADGDDAPFAN